MEDSIFRTRSLGTPAEGVKDQYADGKAAKIWEFFIGDVKQRTQNYRDFLTGLLREKGCRRILDVACGTGIDSVMLLEEGFEVVSIDASDKMLKYALKTRWDRRKEPAFDKWVIEEANWLTLPSDISHLIEEGFDAVICLGNSFAHMPDSFDDQREQRQALINFERCVKPGGLLLIDHRNYDYIMRTGQTPPRCIYYNSQHMSDIKTSVLYVCGKPKIVTMDYMIALDEKKKNDPEYISEFRLSYYPHRLAVFRDMLTEVFSHRAKHTIYGDFKPLNQIEDPAFYIHVLEKQR
ncbi:glycine N-methyltransferase [Monomorium pharaonis]|uniref:glycine N-methyltransferase n=1 Tax=Monomorium pharaonis TaxID=307658 RepID=UPI00063EF9D7|nr:glycine N-methyltransferase [Monomorium pharaonis]